jgi:hypothetical protein
MSAFEGSSDVYAIALLGQLVTQSGLSTPGRHYKLKRTQDRAQLCVSKNEAEPHQDTYVRPEQCVREQRASDPGMGRNGAAEIPSQ